MVETRTLPAFGVGAGPAPDPRAIGAAAAVIRRGGLVAFPTETVYGLGADALSAEAVARIFVAKGRALNDPCIVHIADVDDLARIVAATAAVVWRLADAFWPGPLSLVLPKRASVPDIVTAGRPTVAVRMPDHPVALALIMAAGAPVAAPSANRFMHTSPTTAAHVAHDLAGRIDLILDGGPTTVGLESTIVDLTGPVPRLLRPGGVGLERLQAVLGAVEAPAHLQADEGGHTGAAAPGMMAKHYAPDVEVRLYGGPRAPALAAIRADLDRCAAAGRRAGLLLADEDVAALGRDADEAAVVGSLGAAASDADAAQRLYGALRDLEAAGVVVILARLPNARRGGLTRALRDRLLRAAGGRLLKP